MESVIDSVSINHLLRKPKKAGADKGIRLTCLDEFITSGALVIILDADRGVQSEWESTCSQDAIRTLITYWAESGGIRIVEKVPSLKNTCNRELRKLGFDGPMDKYFLRLAVASNDKNLVSDDSDFWSPGRPKRRGDVSAPVAAYIRNVLGVKLMLLGDLISCCETSQS